MNVIQGIPPTAAADPSGPTPARHLLRRATAPSAEGVISHVDPTSAGWEWIEVTIYRLVPGQRVVRAAGGKERLVLVLEGYATARAGDLDLGRIGSRMSVFDGPACPVLLVSPDDAVDLVADTDALVCIAEAPAGPIRSTRLVESADVVVESRGSGNTARRIHHLLGPADEAGRLIAFEVFTPGGNWSSYPPHKHDTENPPVEALLEEYYFYRFARPQGFAFQRVYTPDRSLDEALTPMDCDAVLVPEGYHPVGVPAGYDCYYLNVMAGPNRAWHFTLDPDHAWLMNWSPSAPRAQEDTTA